MGGPVALTGPDLARGVPLDAIPVEGTLVGHVDGESVLLARVGGDVVAVSATCSHHGAPLGDGIRVGDTVRCPWHHACFDLATGAAACGPALRPLQRYAVARRGDHVRVGAPLPAIPRARRPGLERIVIVGSGAAAVSALTTLRNEGFGGRLTVISRDPDPPYDRPNLSKDTLAGTAPEEWLPLYEPEFYAREDVELVQGTQIEAIDPRTRTVHGADGRTWSYEALLLATGASPIRPPIPGIDLPIARTLRSLADCRALIASSPRRVVIVGAGFIGLEAAAALRVRGVEVTVVAPEAVPLAHAVGSIVGEHLREVHEAHGVDFRLGRTVTTIDERGVVLSDGARVDADVVLVAVGVRPEVGLAVGAGLKVDRGVVVDAQLRTSEPGIWAAGDVARWPDRRTGLDLRIEHWAVAQRQGATAARNMLGADEAFTAVPFFWSVQHEVTLSHVGVSTGADHVAIDGDVRAGDAALAWRRGAKTLAVLTIGRDRTSLLAEAALERDDQAALAELVPGERVVSIEG